MTVSGHDWLIREADEIRSAKDATRAAIYTIFGVVLPVVVTVLVVVFGEHFRGTDCPLLGGVFITLLSLTTMWSQYLWTEYFSYVEYYYTELLPRIYAASGDVRPNYLEWTLPRRRSLWLPITLFNFGVLAVMIVAFSLCIWPSPDHRTYWVALFPVAAAISLATVVAQIARLHRKMRDRAWVHSRSVTEEGRPYVEDLDNHPTKEP